MKRILKLAVVLLIASIPFITHAQQKAQRVMIVFAEDNHIEIPYKFMRSDADERYDSLPMRFVTLKYLFYTTFAERLNQNLFNPIGGVSNDVTMGRNYKITGWVGADSAFKAKNKGKKYFSSVINQDNVAQYNAYITADSVDYVVMINKIEIHGDILRRNLFMYNYFMDVHFDVFDRNMNLIEGRYLRKKVRLSKNMYWTAFTKMFTAMPDELGLYFIGLKK